MIKLLQKLCKRKRKNFPTLGRFQLDLESFANRPFSFFVFFAKERREKKKEKREEEKKKRGKREREWIRRGKEKMMLFDL